MSLARYGGRDGAKVPCVMDADGNARDVSSLASDFGPRTLSPEMIEHLRHADLSVLPVVDTTGLRVASPVAQPVNIWRIGLNHSDHAAEAGQPIPHKPILFSPQMTMLDWEVEQGIIIGKRTLGIPGQGEQRQTVARMEEVA